MIIPKKLAIYYGYPSLVNSTPIQQGTVATAVNVFKQYDIVVFGEGLEINTHPDHTNTKNIIMDTGMINTEVYGYIDSTRVISDFENRVNLWKNMGVKGIFCDKFGYDFAITRSKQNTIIDYVHSKSLKAYIDAWNPDDVFSSTIDPIYNITGVSSHINNNDLYLAQSYQIINGDYQDISFWKSKADKMATYKSIFGTLMTCITTYDTRSFDQSKADYSYYSSVLYNFDAWGWGEYLYSAQTSQLPFRTRKDILGTKFVNSIISNNGIYKRNTNIGIQINTNNHTVNYILS